MASGVSRGLLKRLSGGNVWCGGLAVPLNGFRVETWKPDGYDYHLAVVSDKSLDQYAPGLRKGRRIFLIACVGDIDRVKFDSTVVNT
jgi:hypothetical protein